MEKLKESGIVYKTSRMSYIHNYIIVILLLILLLLIFPHLKIMINPLHFLAFFALLMLVAGLSEEPEWERIFRKYIITNNELIKIDGLLRRKKMVIPYQSVADVVVNKGVIGRIFNFGNVDIVGFKEGFMLKGMRNPEEIQDLIQEKVNLMRAKVIGKGKMTTEE